jgi:hypothetical protein
MKSVLRARRANETSKSQARWADRVTPEIALPPVFGKENAAGSKHEPVFLSGAKGKIARE